MSNEDQQSVNPLAEAIRDLNDEVSRQTTEDERRKAVKERRLRFPNKCP